MNFREISRRAGCRDKNSWLGLGGGMQRHVGKLRILAA